MGSSEPLPSEEMVPMVAGAGQEVRVAPVVVAETEFLAPQRYGIQLVAVTAAEEARVELAAMAAMAVRVDTLWCITTTPVRIRRLRFTLQYLPGGYQGQGVFLEMEGQEELSALFMEGVWGVPLFLLQDQRAQRDPSAIRARQGSQGNLAGFPVIRRVLPCQE